MRGGLGERSQSLSTKSRGRNGRADNTIEEPGLNFSFTDEQEEFRGILRRFFAAKSPPSEVRRLMETADGCDKATWHQLSNELGLPAVAIPEDYGGQGFGFVELSIVLEEMGRCLFCAPYFSSTVLAANSILLAGHESQKQALLPGIAAGATMATLALSETKGGWDADGVSLIATPADGAYQLNGTKTLVLDGGSADLLIVVARLAGTTGDDGITFFLAPVDAAGIERRPLTGIDPTRKLAQVEFHGTRVEPLGNPGEGGAALAKTLQLAAVALAGESVGGAAQLFESTLEYTKMRMQFGRPIGSFQAIKHKCADLLLALELAKSAAYYAAEAVDDNDPDLAAVASLAKAATSDTFMDTARDCIQLHGGIGFTWENDTHLWYKRAKSSQVFLGDPTYHRERLMRCGGV